MCRTYHAAAPAILSANYPRQEEKWGGEKKRENISPWIKEERESGAETFSAPFDV